MRVRDVMSPEPVTVSPQTSISEARRLLRLHGIRHLPVVEGGEVVGVVSDRDITIGDRALAQALRALDSELVGGRFRRVSEVMSQPAHTVDAGETLRSAADLLVRHRVGALPVTSGGRLVGMLSVVDVLRRQAAWHDTREQHPSRAQPPLRLTALGDVRPGRPPQAPVALVINASAAARLEGANELRSAGCTVYTCPGPLGGVTCPGRDGCATTRCARVPAHLDLLLVDRETAGTPLLDAYAEWAPGVTIRITEPVPAG